MCVCVCVCACVCVRPKEKCITFCLTFVYIYTNVKQKIITDIETYISHKNEAGPQWITPLLLNIVAVSLNSNIPLSNEIIYPHPL